MNAIAIVARQAAIKIIKERISAEGGRPNHSEPSVIAAAARDYLAEHPELLDQAAETIARVPALRKLAERQERRRTVR